MAIVYISRKEKRERKSTEEEEEGRGESDFLISFFGLPSLTFKRWSCQSNKCDQRSAMGVSCSGFQDFLVVLTNFTHFSLGIGVPCFVLWCIRHPEDVSSEQLDAAFRDLAVSMEARQHVGHVGA